MDREQDELEQNKVKNVDFKSSAEIINKKGAGDGSAVKSPARLAEPRSPLDEKRIHSLSNYIKSMPSNRDKEDAKSIASHILRQQLDQ